MLIADTAFVPDEIRRAHDLVPVFPQQRGDGARRDTLDHLVDRSRRHQAYFERHLPALTAALSPVMTAAGREARQLLRPILVHVATLYVDRCLRVVHRLRQLENRRPAVVAVEPLPFFRRPSHITQTWHLNQDLIQRIGGAIGIDRVAIFERGKYPEFPDEHAQPNLLFAPPRAGLARLLVSARHRYYRFLSQRSWRASIHTFGLDINAYYLGKRGFWGPLGSLKALPDIDLLAPPADHQLRATLTPRVREVLAQPTADMIGALDPAIPDAARLELGNTAADLFVAWLPTAFLEGLDGNVAAAASAAAKCGPAAALMSDTLGSDRGYFHAVAARLAGREIIGVNHTVGHYGYIEDMYLVGQFEYAMFDRMITWGWTQIDDHLPQCETIPLPSPKLSEAPLHGKRPRSDRDGAVRDVLLLTNLFHRFPHASTCGQARVDFLDEIFETGTALTAALAAAGVTVDHKPYGMKFVDLYPQFYDALAKAGGATYRLLPSRHKGLTPELIASHRMLLWDQLGSGVLECFAAAVPSMVFWPRLYSREAAWARPLVADLERWGIVHRCPHRVADELRRYLADPEDWLAQPDRRRALAAFCHAYARHDREWHREWRRVLHRWARPGGSAVRARTGQA